MYEGVVKKFVGCALLGASCALGVCKVCVLLVSEYNHARERLPESARVRPAYHNGLVNHRGSSCSMRRQFPDLRSLSHS